EEVLNLAAGEKVTVKSTLDDATLKRLPEAAYNLRIITARQAQHAIDRHLKHLKVNTNVSSATHQFISDLCGTEIEIEKVSDGQTKFTMPGELTTRPTKVLRAWKGDGL